MTFQKMLQQLIEFWEKEGCVIHQGYDMEVGAGTFNPATFLRCLGPEPYKAAYIEPSRRPTDGRYGLNPVRLQHYFQFQVMLKPSPLNVQDLCLKSLQAIGFKLDEHDIRFVHDDWESPTLGAWGLGWEVWMDGMEVLQFTYFQSCGGQELKPVTGEITYGLERLASYLQKKESIYDLQFSDDLTYGDIYFRNEVEFSHYNFEQSDPKMWFNHFADYEKEAKKLIGLSLSLPAYDFVMKASHAFNMLDARGAISVTERTGYIGRIRDLAKGVAETYLKSREALGYPLLNKFKKDKKEKTDLEPIEPILLNSGSDQKDDFLLEIGSEELPATFVPIGMRQLEEKTKALLDSQKIGYDKIQVYGTPRRLAILVTGMKLARAEEKGEKRGPQIESAFDEKGDLTPQGIGFFEANHLPKSNLNQLPPGIREVDVKGKKYLVHDFVKPGKSTAAILAEELPKIVLGLEFPKKMRWSDLEISYARPLRWIVAMLGAHTIPFQVGDVVSGKISRGHRQLKDGMIELGKASEYISALKEGKVMADPHERKEYILKQLREIETKLQVKAIAQDKVIPQVLHLVEWPFLTYAEFDSAFLKAPSQVLISEMVEHQKYFPLEDSSGSLKNFFIITANNTPSDQIRLGNQKVISARLKDGVFLYEQDLKIPLDQFNEKLKTVTFQKDLGSVYDKVQRLEKLCEKLQQDLNISTSEKVKKAAHYSKADLASNMVYEFPELQGTMGRIYAEKGGLDKEVALSIEEGWMPRGENAPLPQSETGIILALSDKIDNLNSYFSVGLKPTSSSDPYSLRRQVLGLIKILIQNKLSFPLKRYFTDPEILQFITQRVKTVFQDYGFMKDEIEASFSGGVEDIYDTYLRVNALHQFRKSQSFEKLNEVFKRARGQLEGQHLNGFEKSILKEPAEIALFQKIETIEKPFNDTIRVQKYPEAYTLIADLQKPLDTLFTEVKILDDDPKLKTNRLALLSKVFILFGQLIDFSKIQVK